MVSSTTCNGTELTYCLFLGDWVTGMKKAFNETCHLNLGETRAPLTYNKITEC